MPTLNIRADARTADGNPVPPPTALQSGGPRVPINLTLLPDHQKAKAEKHEPMPPAMTGIALIDTGASQTCFDEQFARQAGLPIVGTGTMTSATDHAVQVPVFAGQIIVAGNININVEQGMGANLTGIPGLLALLGRDVLSLGVLVYNGTDGSVSLSI